MFIDIICFALLTSFAIWLVSSMRQPNNGIYGIIRPQKSKQPKQHICKMPFFPKPAGTLYRCNNCHQVYRSRYLYYKAQYYCTEWDQVSLDDWLRAGGTKE